MTTHYNPLYRGANEGGEFVPATVTDPALALDDRPRVLTRLQSLEHGQAMLSRLAVGDRTALTEAGIVATPREYDTQVHEWGLGFDVHRRHYYLVSGGPNMVNWASPTLEGLRSVAHTHPFHLIDRAAVATNLAPTVAGALTAWLTGMGNLPMTYMPGDLWYLFPSNQDVVASYYVAQPDSELVHTPYRLGADQWLAPSGQGPAISVEYGPVRAKLKPMAEKIIRDEKRDVRNAVTLKTVEEACLMHLWTRATFRAGATVLATGHFQIDPLKKGTSGRSPEFAWFRSTQVDGLLTRAEVHAYILSTAGY